MFWADEGFAFKPFSKLGFSCRLEEEGKEMRWVVAYSARLELPYCWRDSCSGPSFSQKIVRMRLKRALAYFA